MAELSFVPSDLGIRPARSADRDAVIGLTQAGRSQLGAWSPVYFRPREGADEAHAAFLEFVLASDDHPSSVITEGGAVIGFFQTVRQTAHWWIDDLSLDDRFNWVDVVDLIRESVRDRPWVTCVAAHDGARADALVGAGLALASSYWARSLTVEDIRAHVGHGLGETLRNWPRHTFGGMPFDPGLPDALVVCDTDGNFATGSPGVEPPLYDPGGPTAVIDRVDGPDRGRALDLAVGASAARFDAQLVVVVGVDDPDLSSLVADRGFTKHVDLFLCE